jgi:hypothetical protein
MDVQLQIPEILRTPATVEELDIYMATVEDLVLRRALITDRTTTGRVATEIGVHPKIVLQAFDDLRRRQYIDVLKLEGHDYHFTLTTQGRDRAQASWDRCAYASFAPVSMDRYTAVVQMLRADIRVSRSDVDREFSDLVINPRIVERIGPAFSAQQSIFLYGPSGTGKTSIAERFVRLYDDWIVVPHAVEIDGQIISVYDPTVHTAVSPQPPGFDRRWVVCERPFVIAGGELDLSMLQLKRDMVSKVYAAPLQMKANGGIFLIDDFGRQMVAPGALLNRWIVPLERRIDYLSLDSGLKFPIPFEVLVVFSTNLDPAKLGDDAFFRRIQNKIYIGATTIEEFDQILDRAAARFGVAMDEDSHQLVRLVCREFGRGRMYPCYPVDLVKLVKAICDYESLPRTLGRQVLWRAAELYFTAGAAGTGEWQDGQSSTGVFTTSAMNTAVLT